MAYDHRAELTRWKHTGYYYCLYAENKEHFLGDYTKENVASKLQEALATPEKVKILWPTPGEIVIGGSVILLNGKDSGSIYYRKGSQ